MYKLVCIDMDGTLLDSKKNISQNTIDTLKAANEKGIYIVITTGRICCNAAYHSAHILGVNSPVIAANGAIIKNRNADDAVYKSLIPKEVCLKILELSNEYRVSPSFITTNKIYGKSKLFSLFLYHSVYKTEIDKYNVKISGVSRKKWNKVLDAEGHDIMKCEIYDASKKKISKIRDALRSLGTLEVVTVGENGLDIVSRSITKGHAVKKLAEHLNIRREEIIAIGDNNNDIEMLEYAGLGVAMGNASDSIKSKADYVTSTNDEDGVAKVVNEFILNAEDVSA